MNRPSDWETANRSTDFKSLPAGGYICKILRVEERTSKGGKPMLAIAVDIDDGEYKGYFRKLFDSRLQRNPKAAWPCIAYCLTEDKDGNTNPNFKNFIESVKESNSGWQPAWGDTFCEPFKHRKIGLIFVREQYQGTDGNLHWSTKPDFGHFKNVEQIRGNDFTVPEDKPYKGLIVESAPANIGSAGAIPEGFEVIPEEDVPF